MKQKIFLLFAIFVGFAMQTLATAATPDSVFVVKNGRIVSAYEVGKDVDNISFPKRIQLDGNCVKVGDEVVEMKSAVVTTVNNYKYIYLSTLEGCKTTEDVMRGGKNLQLAFSPTLLDKYVEFNAFGHDFDADKDFFQAVFMDVDEYNRNDDYEPVSVSSYDWNDYYSDGLLQVSFAGGKLALNLEATPKKGETLLAAQYNGAYTEVAANENHFIVDGKRYEMRAAFAEKKADGVNFYLTPGNIDSANELDNCYYYVRLFVPQSNMDGSELDVQGNKKYELTFVDNVTDVNNPQTFSISNDAPSSATGTISVLDNGDGTYTIKINVANLGNTAARTLDVVYVNGTPKEYSLAVPSNYTVADGKPVDLKSAVLTHDDAEGVYTIYLSAKAGVTTLAGMADADIVVTMPDAFANDNSLHGFSGDETNAKISIKYAGDTYSQATVNGTNSIALGGNAKLTFADGKADVDFTVFSIKKYNGALKGHYEGNVTRL